MIKNIYAVAALMTAAIAFPVQAQTKAEDHKAHHPEATASAPAAKSAVPKSAEKAASSGMQGHMDKHCADMEKIMKIKDAKKRQKAMEDHKKKMHDEGGCSMMKDGMGMGKEMGSGSSAPTDMKGGMKEGMGK